MLLAAAENIGAGGNPGVVPRLSIEKQYLCWPGAAIVQRMKTFSVYRKLQAQSSASLVEKGIAFRVVQGKFFLWQRSWQAADST